MSDVIEGVKNAIELLEANGYLVFQAPECLKTGRGHGRHVLLTRSAVCEGEDPIPHGYRSTHFGTFGPWVGCMCGGSFNDYSEDDAGLTSWETHKRDFIDQGRRADDRG